jgi:hypothetical protein
MVSGCTLDRDHDWFPTLALYEGANVDASRQINSRHRDVRSPRPRGEKDSGKAALNSQE